MPIDETLISTTTVLFLLGHIKNEFCAFEAFERIINGGFEVLQ